MLITCLTLLFSLLGLGFLICIHELGHLLAARSVGMHVECFGIGFGKPWFRCTIKSVPVHFGWIPFGGYVRIAGMEDVKGKKTDPNGFFSKTPLARAWVACAGPLANILFCLVAFGLVWLGGGRSKPYSFMTNRIGVLDQKSTLYEQGVRPGDKIISYGQQKVTISRDHLQAAMTTTDGTAIQVESLHSGKERTINAFPYSLPGEKEIKTFGVMAPASFLVWMPSKSGLKASYAENQFRTGDRIVWANGEEIYCLGQLRERLNQDEVYLTVERDGKRVHLSIPRCSVSDLKLTPSLRGELMDWMYEAQLPKTKLAVLSFIPYNLTQEGVVEGPIEWLHPTEKKQNDRRGVLQIGDRIVAAWGSPLSKASDLVKTLQQPKAVLIVERGGMYKKVSSEKELDQLFTRPYLSEEMPKKVASIGTKENHEEIEPTGVHLEVLTDVPLITRGELLHPHMPEPNIESKELFLGLVGVQDVMTNFNPSPKAAMTSLYEEITSTLHALFTGAVSPKLMSGPVGIVQLVQQQWAYGFFDVLFWLGAISFNLALLNLLPLPVLDGGYILMSCIELITFRRVSPKLFGKIVTPFAILLFLLLIYLTYNDVIRIIRHVMK